MGLLGAIGAGLREVGGAGEKVGLEQMKDQMEQERAARLMELQQTMRLREDEVKRGRDEAQAKRLRTEQATEIEAEAKNAAGLRASSSASKQGDAAADAYRQALDKGLINQDDANAGYKAAADYVNDEVANAKVSQDDRTQAAIRLGYISPKDAATLSGKEAEREMRTAIAQGKWENALALAQLKGEFGMALGELKAAARGGDEKATELMRNWQWLQNQGMGKEEIVDRLLSGKVGEYTTVTTERQNDDGSVTKTTEKRKPNADRPAGANTKFVLKDGKLVPASAR